MLLAPNTWATVSSRAVGLHNTAAAAAAAVLNKRSWRCRLYKGPAGSQYLLCCLPKASGIAAAAAAAAAAAVWTLGCTGCQQGSRARSMFGAAAGLSAVSAVKLGEGGGSGEMSLSGGSSNCQHNPIAAAFR
jgi:hypothetical protein